MASTVTQTKVQNGVANSDSTAQNGVIHTQAAPAEKDVVANGDAEVAVADAEANEPEFDSIVPHAEVAWKLPKAVKISKQPSATTPNGSVKADRSSNITFRNDLPVALYLGPIKAIDGHWDPRRSPPSYIPPYGVVKVTLKDNFGFYGSEGAITVKIGNDEHDRAVARFACPTAKDNWARWDIESATGRYQWEVSSFSGSGPLFVDMIVKEIAVVRGLSAAALVDRSSTLTIRNDTNVPIKLGPVVVIHGYWDPAYTPPNYISPKGIAQVTLKDRFGMYGSEGAITFKVNGSEDDRAVATFGCPNVADNYAEWHVESSTGKYSYVVSSYSYNGPLVVDFTIKAAHPKWAANGAVANEIVADVEAAEAVFEETQLESAVVSEETAADAEAA